MEANTTPAVTPSADSLAKMPGWMKAWCEATPEAAARRLAYLAEADARTVSVTAR